MTRKEILIGIIFATCVTVLLNYIAIERVLGDGLSFWSKKLSTVRFSLVWYGALSFVMYSYFTIVFRIAHHRVKRVLLFVGIVIVGILISYIISEIYPTIQGMFVETKPLRKKAAKIAMRGELSTTLSKHLLVMLTNLLMAYTQRMIYSNQQLQLEKVKAEHNALIHQINPHFFFNSLNGLNYLIVKEENKKAKAYLDNLTSVFRQILKHNGKNIYTLVEEMEFIHSYIYILNRRYGHKLMQDNIHFLNDYFRERCRDLDYIE